MRTRALDVLTASSLLLIASATTVQAQSNPGAPAASDTTEWGLEEIIVTARRRSESLQDVPQTVNAYTGEDLEKLNLQRFEDVQTLVPGLTLTSGNNGLTTSASMRGATFVVESSASPTVALYQNDAPISANTLFQSMYDVSQIEVLRGPQGTLRGAIAPSGAITVTTRRPDLSEAGAYVNTTGTNQGGINVHGAVSVPLINDVLAVRFAGIFDENDYDGVTSVNNGGDPKSETKGGRATLRFEPTDSVSAALIYQYLQRELSAYDQVVGSGSPGGIVPGRAYPAPPAGYNGPAIDSSDRLGVGDFPRVSDQEQHTVTGLVDWSFAGQKVSYVGTFTTFDLRQASTQDNGNLLPGNEFYQLNHTEFESWSHELRLASEERIAGVLDYTIGAFASSLKPDTALSSSSFLSGAFGSPLAAPTPTAPNPRYTLPLSITSVGEQTETSFFGSVTWHLGEKTELTAGGRYVIFKNERALDVLGGAAFIAIPGLGDIPLAPSVQTSLRSQDEQEPFIYNASISHRFSDDFLVYANTGTAWRAGPTSVITFPTSAPGFVPIQDFVFHVPEESTSYEVGFKSSFLDNRARLNVAVYRQNFDDYLFFSEQTYHLAINSRPPNEVRTFGFTANADAVVDGVDVDASFQITPRWNVATAYSWSEGVIDDDDVPCNDGNFDGQADEIVPSVAGFTAAGVLVARCVSDGSISRSPKWNASLQSEFSVPVSNSIDAFVRGLYTYYPDNPNRNKTFVVDSYDILSVFAGVRSPDNVWEVSIFAKNATNKSNVLSRDDAAVTSSGLSSTFGPTGYFLTSFTPRREIGLNVRYAFGSR